MLIRVHNYRNDKIELLPCPVIQVRHERSHPSSPIVVDKHSKHLLEKLANALPPVGFSITVSLDTVFHLSLRLLTQVMEPEMNKSASVLFTVMGSLKLSKYLVEYY